jgi:hypothetical protein
MPFRSGFDDIYDQNTLALLQGIFDSVWPILSEANTSISREELARRILAAYRSGCPPEQINDAVLRSYGNKPGNGR